MSVPHLKSTDSDAESMDLSSTRRSLRAWQREGVVVSRSTYLANVDGQTTRWSKTNVCQNSRENLAGGGYGQTNSIFLLTLTDRRFVDLSSEFICLSSISRLWRTYIISTPRRSPIFISREILVVDIARNYSRFRPPKLASNQNVIGSTSSTSNVHASIASITLWTFQREVPLDS